MKKTLALIFTLAFLFAASVACANSVDAINGLVDEINATAEYVLGGVE